MFTIILKATLAETAGAIADLRTSVDDWGENPIIGVYDPAVRGWRFELDTARYIGGFGFKFFIHPGRWQQDPNLELRAPDSPDDAADDVVRDGDIYSFEMASLEFQNPIPTEPPIEVGRAHRTIFNSRVDSNTLYDVIVIGSGMAGGTVADFASDQGLSVLLLEAGGMLFPTHIGNLPRQHAAPGAFAKHIWALWDEFGVRNYDAGNPNDYDGAQGFNLGGRSLFWGGFIPRMTSWELDFWPTRLKWYLEDSGYVLAEDFMGRSTGPRTQYNRQVHLALRALFPDMHHANAPMAIRQNLEGMNTIATGVFSTADVLMDSHLSPSPAGREGLNLLLNHEVIKVNSQTSEVQVVARDRVREQVVSFRGKTVVLSAGCIESARLAKRSGFPDPKAFIGRGASDHPIFFTHFSIPRESPYFDPFGNVKTLSQPKEGTNPQDRAPFNMLLELGADLNHGRYIDEDVWLDHLRNRKDKMLCEVVFLCNERLEPQNNITFSTNEQTRPLVSMRKFIRPDLQAQTDDLKWRLLKSLAAQPTKGPKYDFRVDEVRWKQAFLDVGDSGEGMPGGVAHEVGSLRMQVTDQDGNVKEEGLVDEDCQYFGLPNQNVFVCDLSIFPTTPAANPSLTVVALAIRLASHLAEKLRPQTETLSALVSSIADEIDEKAKAFSDANDIEVTQNARNAIADFIPELAERNPDWGEDLLRDLDEFLEIAAGLRSGLDLRNSLLQAAMSASAGQSMPQTANVDVPQIQKLIRTLSAFLLPTP